MKGVSRGERVRFTMRLEPAPGASTFQRKTAPTVQATGVVLDRAAGSGQWWVMPTGERRAVVVNARDMEPLRNAQHA